MRTRSTGLGWLQVVGRRVEKWEVFQILSIF